MANTVFIVLLQHNILFVDVKPKFGIRKINDDRVRNWYVLFSDDRVALNAENYRSKL